MPNTYALIPRPTSTQYHPGTFTGTETNIRIIPPNKPMASEAYRLEITPTEILLQSSTPTGTFRGTQTARQLFLTGNIPRGIIEDAPRFPWRGFMLDCSRHFYTPDFIKHLLDLLSLHHINIFHWGLTNDQGWRLPVERYPLLTEIGAKRKDLRDDQVTAGFYTPETIRDIVAYAAARHIEVMPEVNFPGHTSALLAAYPRLGCTGGPYQVEDRFGIFEDVLCAGNDDIFPLIEAVFDTLTELFPSPYVHIGGDEVRFNRWANCPKCRQRLANAGLANPAGLQSMLTARFARMLSRRGKTAVVWEEDGLLEHTEKFPLPEDLIVMSWRGHQGDLKALAAGRRVIMTPMTEGCYLDYKHLDRQEEPGRLGVNTVAQSFHLNPAPPEMPKAAAALVLGGQGNLWSEGITADKLAEYMIFPRLCALAEALWSGPGELPDFIRRLTIHQRRLDKLGVLQYRGPVE